MKIKHSSKTTRYEYNVKQGLLDLPSSNKEGLVWIKLRPVRQEPGKNDWRPNSYLYGHGIGSYDKLHSKLSKGRNLPKEVAPGSQRFRYQIGSKELIFVEHETGPELVINAEDFQQNPEELQEIRQDYN